MTRTGPIGLVMTATLALASLAGAAPAGAAFPGDNGLIAFTSDRDGNFEIYTMAADGSAQRRLTSNEAPDHGAAWSPDGKQIAFGRGEIGGDIYTMAADGSAQTSRTSNTATDFAPTWSPDGFRIAFATDRGVEVDPEIYTMAPDGAAQTPLTANGDFDSDPAWSPDGTQIASMKISTNGIGIYTMAADGSAPKLLSNNTADFSPSWSPDGTRIAFASERDGNREIYTMGADGSGPVRLTRNLVDDYAPAWSPDGTRIAFTSERDGNPEIYTMGVGGSDQIRITNNVVIDSDADWQPVAHVPATPSGPPAEGTLPAASPPAPPAQRPSAESRGVTVSGLSLTRRAFCVGRACPRERRGTLVRFALSAPAVVEFALERRVSGRRADGRCRRPTRRNRAGRRCDYYADAGGFSKLAAAGANSVAFSGRIGGRALRPGRYRLSLTAVGAGGARSAVARIRLRMYRAPATSTSSKKSPS